MKWYTLIFLMGFAGTLTYAYTSYSTPSHPNQGKYHASSQESICLMGNDPVCGTNGFENFLLDNQCEFNDFNGKQLQAGQMVLEKIDLTYCYPSPTAQHNNPASYCPQYCNSILRPVCGSYQNVQRNFTNECEMRRYMCAHNENWQLILNDTCVDKSCAADEQEICASFEDIRQTFANLVSLYDEIQATGKNWQILNVGPCPCPTDYRPICAKLNCTTKTFQNECFLQQEIKTASYWSILFYGECPMLPTPCPITNNTATTNTTTNLTTTATPTTPTPITTITPATNTTSSDTTTTTTTTPEPGNSNPAAPGDSNAAASSGSNVATPGCNQSANSTSNIYNRPVYIVKQNKILPYGHQSYRANTSSYRKNTYVASYPATSSHNYGCGSSSGKEESYSPANIQYTSSSSGKEESYGPANIQYTSSYKKQSQTADSGKERSYSAANIQYLPNYSGSSSHDYKNYPYKDTGSSPSSGYVSSYSQPKPIKNVYSNSNGNDGYKSPSYYSKSSYKTEYSSKYNSVRVESSDGVSNCAGQGEYDTSAEYFT